MRARESLSPETLASIDESRECGPWMPTAMFNGTPLAKGSGIWKPGQRYWVCDYHEGFQDGVDAVMAEA